MMHETRTRRFGLSRFLGTRDQRRRSLVCPDSPRLEGKLALVTGGNGGIGFETCRGLLERGAEVVMACRDSDRAARACERLEDAADAAGRIEALPLDLADLDSVAGAADLLLQRLDGRALDILIANAGIWPRSYSTSAQGYEVAFGVNVLGHSLLIRRLLEAMPSDGRLIVLTGDIYVLTSDCTPDFTYRGAFGGMLAYCRSKLGDLWLVEELHRRYPNLAVFAVHPGVVDSNLGRSGAKEGKSGGGPLIDCAAGAQTSLYCATQPDLVRGGYYHNTLGRMELDPSDPARDRDKALALWETCERLCGDRL